MSESSSPQGAPRIVVALDASPHSVKALEVATELAALMDAEVEGLFVEDISLLYLCELPFGREIGSHTAVLRCTDNVQMERHLRVVAACIRESVERVAARSSVRCRFSVRRGVVAEELLTAARDAALLGIGRVGRSRRRGLGSTARALAERGEGPLLISGEGSRLDYPLTVLFTGTPAARRALDLALRLSRGEAQRLRVVAWSGDTSTDAEQMEHDARDRVTAQAMNGDAVVMVVHATAADVTSVLRGLDAGTLVLPREQAALVAGHGGPVLLVP